jgi:hypothetical protein
LKLDFDQPAHGTTWMQVLNYDVNFKEDIHKLFNDSTAITQRLL